MSLDADPQLPDDSYPDTGGVIAKNVYRVLDEFIAENIIELKL